MGAADAILKTAGAARKSSARQHARQQQRHGRAAAPPPARRQPRGSPAGMRAEGQPTACNAWQTEGGATYTARGGRGPPPKHPKTTQQHPNRRGSHLRKAEPQSRIRKREPERTETRTENPNAQAPRAEHTGRRGRAAAARGRAGVHGTGAASRGRPCGAILGTRAHTGGQTGAAGGAREKRARVPAQKPRTAARTGATTATKAPRTACPATPPRCRSVAAPARPRAAAARPRLRKNTAGLSVAQAERGTSVAFVGSVFRLRRGVFFCLCESSRRLLHKNSSYPRGLLLLVNNLKQVGSMNPLQR